MVIGCAGTGASRLRVLAVATVVLSLGGVAQVRAASLPTGGMPELAATRKPLPTRVTGKPRVATGGLPVLLFHVNHRETMRLRLADERGKPIRGLQRQMDNFLRCHYTNQRHAMNPRLTRLLYEIGRHYPGKRIEVVSGYRHPRFAKNPHSPHKKGLACDMRVPGVKNTELRDFFRQNFKSVGVGYYPNSSFVHLDVRHGASAFWIDYSGPGETAVYSKNALADLRSGRADRQGITVIDPSWADEDEESDVEVISTSVRIGRPAHDPAEDPAEAASSAGEGDVD